MDVRAGSAWRVASAIGDAFVAVRMRELGRVSVKHPVDCSRQTGLEGHEIVAPLQDQDHSARRRNCHERGRREDNQKAGARPQVCQDQNRNHRQQRQRAEHWQLPDAVG